MTCIVGLAERGSVYIGGDSAGISGTSITIRGDEKVFENGPLLIGITTSFRMRDLLKYKLNPPKQTSNQTDIQYMCTDFIDSVRKCFADNGFGNGTVGGTFLVGYNEVLYTVGGDFQVGVPTNKYDSVGCGSDIALGAMYALKNKRAEERIKLSLEAASAFSAGVAPPFVIMKQTRKGL